MTSAATPPAGQDQPPGDRPHIQSCGFLIIRGHPVQEFLLMRHVDRWDLPKGHRDPGETELACALRELEEETGIRPEAIDILPDFRFTLHYPVHTPRDGLADKTLVVFLARLRGEVPIRPTEHRDYRWFPWSPPHRIQPQTIDPLLAAVERYFAEAGAVPQGQPAAKQPTSQPTEVSPTSDQASASDHRARLGRSTG